MSMTCCCCGFSGLGYIVGSKVAEALDGWQWSLRVSLSLRHFLYFCYELEKLLRTQAVLSLSSVSYLLFVVLLIFCCV